MWPVRPAGMMVYLATTRSVVFTDRRPILTEEEGRIAQLMAFLLKYKLGVATDSTGCFCFVLFFPLYILVLPCVRRAGIMTYLARSSVVFTDRPPILKRDSRTVQLIKFVETWMDSFFFSFFPVYLVVCASRRRHGIPGDDDIAIRSCSPIV